MPASKYHRSMPNKLIEIMSQGDGPISVCKAFGVDPETLRNWCDPERESAIPEMVSAMQKGKIEYQDYWEQMAKAAVKDKRYNVLALIWNMKNRFSQASSDHPWQDRPENEIGINANLSINITGFPATDAMSQSQARAQLKQALGADGRGRPSPMPLGLAGPADIECVKQVEPTPVYTKRGRRTNRTKAAKASNLAGNNNDGSQAGSTDGQAQVDALDQGGGNDEANGKAEA